MASHPKRLPFLLRKLSRRSDRPLAAQAQPRRNALLKAIVALSAAAGIVLISGAAAHADPTPAQLEAQLDAAWNKLEPIIEQHNATRQQLAQNRAKSAELNKQIEPLELQVDLAMSRVGEMAVLAYKGGGRTSSISALLDSGSPTALADQLSMLDQVARMQQEQVRAVGDLRLQYEAKKAPLDQMIAQLAKTEAELAAKEKEINAEIDRLQAMRQRAYGTSGGSTGSLRPASCPTADPGGKAGIAVRFACAQIGKPYSWGASGPNSYDCSGLTMAAWNKAGVSLPHNAAAQRSAIPSVSKANLRPGDLVFYYSDLHHVGMYVGGGWIVHASRAGEPVKMRVMDNGSIHSYGRPG